jgi:hypothetical protein
MADIFSGTAPANVNTTTTAATNLSPGFQSYQDYLSNIASAGNASLATPENQLVAPLSSNQIGAFGAAPTAATTYQTPLINALATSNTAASPLGASQINQFFNPYVSDVNKNLETATQQNINQSILPSLQALGASTGQTGSSRLLNATGQALGGIQQALGAQESANLSEAYKNAVTSALQEQSNLGNIANVQGNLASTGQSAANSALTTQAALGAQEQAQKQAIINAPLQNATSVAGLMKGFNVPTTSTTNYTGPANVYGPSQLSQLLAVGSLANSLPAGTLSGLGTKLTDLLSSAPKSGIPTVNDTTGLTLVPNATTAGYGQLQGADGKVYVDPSYGTNSSKTPIVSSDQLFNNSLPAGYYNIGGGQAYNPETGDTIDQSQGP